MKLAVVIGVAHMSMGVVMKGLNALYFRQTVNFVFEFIPQIVMLLSLFGYMDYIIMVKWTTDWDGREDRSPSIIATMIGMFLGGGEIPEKTDALLHDAQYQKEIQLRLLFVVLICAPMMLIPKPIIEYMF